MKNIKLIDNWKRAWKFASIRWSTLGLVLMGIFEFINQTWYSLPEEIRSNVPHASSIGMVLFALTILGRLFKKEKRSGDE